MMASVAPGGGGSQLLSGEYYSQSVGQIRLTQGRKDAGGPEHLTAQRREEQQAAHPGAVGVLQRVQHRHVALRPHLVGEENPPQHEAESVAEWCLAPDEAVVEDNLGRAVDVAAADPGGRHGEDSNEHPDVTTGQHGLLLDKQTFVQRTNLAPDKAWADSQ